MFDRMTTCMRAGVVTKVDDSRGLPAGWDVTMADGWTLFAPMTLCPVRPMHGDRVVYVMSSREPGNGRVRGLMIGERVYVDPEPEPFVDAAKCVPGDTRPERVSDGAILDAVRAAVLELLVDREMREPHPITDERVWRWAVLRAAVSMPAERVAPSTNR